MPFLHIVSIVVLITLQGLIICITRFLNLEKNYSFIFKSCKNLAIAFFITFSVTVLTGFLLSQNGDFKFSDPMIESVINTKYAIAFLLLCNFSYIIYRFFLAKECYKKADYDEMNEHLIIAVNYFMILDIVLLLISTYLGVVIVSFK
ncbi:hypothetical protein [Campylobacter ureolyticus]|uniref:Uncharacterized protein n=1 Tax=Campylobacter ureolyticus TaxID=827 RepID=A0A9Q4KLY0_9BACT|nr:hypothetical protein [Campylobacter ureolyticus]MCR8699521.1 hypothetical protein [Campylobacter ureolyticus]MCZ6155784.1 hypothetical protein [Campylobacter ureolyticus]MCZ6160064.1 hypothetical protein [Campylobacter ureolyticus]MCZ6163737.1 hypothetical protein [Campylobacter ureolyticus]MCZ6165647.1 hypothetical protein [Campylobacter ureolyticus]